MKEFIINNSPVVCFVKVVLVVVGCLENVFMTVVFFKFNEGGNDKIKSPIRNKYADSRSTSYSTYIILLYMT